jgi:hypothetical protein
MDELEDKIIDIRYDAEEFIMENSADSKVKKGMVKH